MKEQDVKVQIVHACKSGGESVYPGTVLKLSPSRAAILINTKKAKKVADEVKEVTVTREEYQEKFEVEQMEKQLLKEEKEAALRERVSKALSSKKKKSE